MTVKDILLCEIESLPEERQADVLAFVRYLKLTAADDPTIERRFDAAVSEARRRVAGKGISEDQIAAEIKTARNT